MGMGMLTDKHSQFFRPGTYLAHERLPTDIVSGATAATWPVTRQGAGAVAQGAAVPQSRLDGGMPWRHGCRGCFQLGRWLPATWAPSWDVVAVKLLQARSATYLVVQTWG